MPVLARRADVVEGGDDGAAVRAVAVEGGLGHLRSGPQMRRRWRDGEGGRVNFPFFEEDDGFVGGFKGEGLAGGRSMGWAAS